MIYRFLTGREQLIIGCSAIAILLGALVYWHAANPAEPPEARETTVYVLEGVQNAPPPHEPLPPIAEDAPIAPEPVDAPPAGTAPAPVIVVAVQGEVLRPGVYDFPPNTRIRDALEAAGGPAPGADLSDINLAAPLIDATTLAIPRLPFAGQQDGTVVLRRSPGAAALNPPQYTRSGWGGRHDATGGGPADGAPFGAADASGRINLNTATRADLESLPGIGPVTAGRIIAHREQHPFGSVEELENVSGIGPKRLEAVRDLVTAP